MISKSKSIIFILVNSKKKLARKMSICCDTEMIEEKTSKTSANLIEVDVIPPLPLFALFAADTDNYSNNQDDQVDSKRTRQKSAFDSLDDNLNKRENDLNEDDLKLNLNNDDDFDFDTDGIDREKHAQILAERKLEKERLEFKKNLLNNSSNNTIYFNSKVCTLLNEYLLKFQLNGLSRIDQMYLIALADTVANVKCDVAFDSQDENDLFKKKEFVSNNENGDNNNEIAISQTVDNCGLKFLLALRSYNYLLRTLPESNKEKLKEIGLGTVNYAWAYHSECEQELINSISKFSSLNNNNTTSNENFGIESNQKNSITWSDLRQYGIGWWVKSTTVLKQLIEKLAKCLFQQKMDPLDAALFYLAMKKKGVLLALYKTIKDVKMTEFFKNDFTESKWQTAALKNAFVLLGKQRFEHAAAFFLLAGRLKDAIEVCVQNLKDLQLALVIVRLYETDIEKLNQYLKAILSVELMGYSLQADQSGLNQFGLLSSQPDKQKISKDPFLRSMTYWFLKDYKKALHTLFDIDLNNESKSNEINQKNAKSSSDLLHFSNSDTSRDSIIPHVFNFYSFLKNHPLVLKLQSIQSDDLSSIKKNDSGEITPIERRLHFIAGYYHLINGCPLLTLDVLSKLPKYIDNETNKKEDDQEPKKYGYDFTDNKQQPTQIVNKVIEKASDFDWSAPVKKFEDEELELDFGLSDSNDSDEDNVVKKEVVSENLEISKPDQLNKTTTTDNDNNNDKNDKLIDTFAQQIKFISCLKILIDEMSTLATGFEVQGGQLRYYMYYWLERETQVLKEMGEYNQKIDFNKQIHEINSMSSFTYDNQENDSLLGSYDQASMINNLDTSSQPSLLLHEQVMKDQRTFQAKISRLNKRKEWLRSNELLLRTFLSYCSLHSASGGGLCSVKMELVLLMQELVEDRSMKQLLLPVPVPTTIPLLSASIATSKNVVAGPIQMLKSFVQDILSSLSAMHTIPTIFDYSVIILTVKELAVSLSSCIYQCLCDSDALIVSENEVVTTGMQGFSRNILYKSTYLMSGMKKNTNKSIKAFDRVQTSPKNWPGVSSLTKLLEREQDVEAPKLKILLFESLISVYSSLLINSFIFYDCSTLLRLLTTQWNEQMWNILFGGGCMTEYKYKTQQSKIVLDDENVKQRMKINAKLGHRPSVSYQTGSSPSNSDEKIYIREHFIAPEINMINYFLNRPLNDENDSFPMGNASTNPTNEDSEDDDDEEKRDVFDEDPEMIYGKRYWEHMNPKSYSWCLMRYGILKYTIFNIQSFLAIIGIELQELATLSPLVHQLLKTFENWKELTLSQLKLFNGPPDDYIPGCNLNNSINVNGPKILKYQSMLDPANTPFINEKSTLEPRRLWNFLVTRKCLHDVFIRYIFKKKSQQMDFSTKRADTTLSSNMTTASSNNQEHNVDNTNTNQYTSFCKIVHKDQEPIYNFCLNERDKNTLALCTSKEIIEMDIRNLMVKNAPIDDEYEMDILALQNTKTNNYEQDVYVIGNSLLPNDSNTSLTPNYETQPSKTNGRSPQISNVVNRITIF